MPKHRLKAYSLRLEDELRKELEEIALENNRNLKQEIELAIKHYIKQYKKRTLS